MRECVYDYHYTEVYNHLYTLSGHSTSVKPQLAYNYGCLGGVGYRLELWMAWLMNDWNYLLIVGAKQAPQINMSFRS